MTKFLSVQGRMVNTRHIDQVLLPDKVHATVWLTGRAEPLHAELDEVQAIRQYVAEAVNA